MPARSIGTVTIAKNRKDYACKLCKETILKNTFTVKNTFRIKSGFWVNTRYHEDCFDKFFIKWKDNSKESLLAKPNNGGSVALYTPEVARRRVQLHWYLNQYDKNKLIEAYTRKDTTRVFRVMGNMYRRIVELDATGKTFSAAFINKNGPCKELIMKHDRPWFDELANSKGESNRWVMFVRNVDEGPQPDWTK